MKKILLFITLFLLTKVSYGQTETESSRIKVYTPSSSASSTSNSYKWAVKTDLFSFLTGEFPIIGEYRVAEKISLEASIGLTYAFWPNGSSFFDSLDDYSSSSTEASMGSAFRIGAKYYPSLDWDAIEGWGFGVQIYSITDNRTYIADGFDISADSNLKDSQSKMGAMLTISKQLFWDANISYEYLIGVGFAATTRDYYDFEFNDALGTTTLVNKTDENSAPTFKIGLRIGFGN